MVDIHNTTTLYCQHHGEGNPSILLFVAGIQPVERLSKPDDRQLREAGITTIRRAGRDSDVRSPLTLNTLRVIGRNKIFEIHCEEGCTMVDVLAHLAKGYAGDKIVFLVNALKPDDDYSVIHRELVTVQPGRFVRGQLPTVAYGQNLIASKIRNRGRCLFAVTANVCSPSACR